MFVVLSLLLSSSSLLSSSLGLLLSCGCLVAGVAVVAVGGSTPLRRARHAMIKLSQLNCSLTVLGADLDTDSYVGPS